MDLLFHQHVYIGGKRAKVSLSDDGLSWEWESTPDFGQRFLISEILSCWLCPKGSLSCCPSFTAEDGLLQQQQQQQRSRDGEVFCPHTSKEHSRKGLTMEVCERGPSRKWLTKVVVLKHHSHVVLLALRNEIWRRIRGLSERPQRLLVMVNPVGGRKKGLRIHQNKLLPFFRRARISASMVQTEYKGHGTQLIQDLAAEGRLAGVDGVVVVGGDGLVSEIVTGLFVTAAFEKGVDPHSSSADLPRTSLRVGIVPSGSTDAICYATHGINDVVTSILHIIMGDRRCIDVAALHSEKRLRRIVTSFVSYGYFGDLLRASERLRWLGPPRYVISGARQILSNRSHSVSIAFKGELGSEKSAFVNSDTCSNLCSVCDSLDGGEEEAALETWNEIRGNYVIVTAAVTSCACKLTPKGVSPSAHLGDGLTDLIVVRGSSRSKLLSYLYHTGLTGHSSHLSHVDVVRTKELRFRASSPARSTFNCDGEELEASHLNIRVHRQKLQLFCRGVEDPPPPQARKIKSHASP